MNSILYLIQVTLIFSVLYILYKVFLEKLTFHKLNRIVLLSLLPISIIIPFSGNLLPSIASKVVKVPLFEYTNFESISNKLQIVEQPIIESTFSYSSILVLIYAFVFLILFIRIICTARHLFILKSNSKIHRKNDYNLIIADVPEIFSYFNWVFIPIDQYDQYDNKIIEHEKAHIKLKHSWDVIFSEIYIAFFWFNPLLYFYRKSLKSVHEYQADMGVLKNGVQTLQYIQLLLESIQISRPNNLYNYFNQPILKKRVIMMTKPKSNRLSKLKYMLLLPVCVFLISAFTTPIIENNKFTNLLDIYEYTNTTPSLFPVQNATKEDVTSHFGEEAKRVKTNKRVIHNGIDIRAKVGTPVLATADGIIAKASLEGNWGNLIVITHVDGYETWYAHLNGFNTQKNQNVKKGDIIGYVGNTGLSNSPHLHYEIKQNGNNLNPINFLE